jgi:hypothetical protein
VHIQQTLDAAARVVERKECAPAVWLQHRQQWRACTCAGPRTMSKLDDEKLIYGLVFTLRTMVQKLGGEDDTFLSYRTGEYKLHYYETPTRMKFVMLTDTQQNNLRPYLHQIWANLYVEFVVKNPLAPVEHTGGVGVANTMFEKGLDTFLMAVLPA